MKVIVDTSVWSLALRRKKPVTDFVIAKFTRVITAGRVILPGVIRQEILSGIPDREAYEKLRVKLTAFPDYLSTQKIMRRRQSFLIHAAAMGYRVPIPIF